jgi:hypothetical protein
MCKLIGTQHIQLSWRITAHSTIAPWGTGENEIRQEDGITINSIE